jgi:hypothetical protein
MRRRLLLNQLLHQFVVCVVSHWRLLNELLLLLAEAGGGLANLLLLWRFWVRLVLGEAALARLNYIRKKIVLVRLREQHRLLLLHLGLGADVRGRLRNVVVCLCFQALMVLLLEALLLKLVLELRK